jgi:hypothetical protein
MIPATQKEEAEVGGYQSKASDEQKHETLSKK